MKCASNLILALTVTCVPLSGQAAAGDDVFFSWIRKHDNANSPPALYPASGTTNHYSYCPHAGGQHGPDVEDNKIKSIWSEMEDAGLAVAIMMRDRNSPWGSAPTWDCLTSCGGSIPDYPINNNILIDRSPWTLASAFAIRDLESDQMDYVIGDVEPHDGNSMTDVANWVVNMADICFGSSSLGVTGYPDGTSDPTHNISQATVQSWDVRLGNYNTHRYPTLTIGVKTVPTDITSAWDTAGQSDDLADQQYLYTSAGLNVISPDTYPRANHVRHTVNHWTTDLSPTVRAAYLWSGVEKLSSALREEIAYGNLATKEILPWVTPFVHQDLDPTGGLYADCWMPPSTDFLATIKHLRLRGADGFIFFGGEDNLEPDTEGGLDLDYWSRTHPETGEYLNPWYTSTEDWADATATPHGYEWFEKHALVSWEELDGDFADNAVPYRLETDKTSGIVVSAINDKGRLNILVSYMKPVSRGPTVSIDMDDFFKEARDYSSGTNQYITCTGYSHVYSRDFFTPDIDGDNDYDSTDASIWAGLYAAEDPRADWNQDGLFNSTDITLFGDAAAAY
ncbi:MAG: hypothetical protein JJ916_05220 [Phycisphaerales bacterium]|nr:hypothetical protein [Phycisphaerales bacterium]